MRRRPDRYAPASPRRHDDRTRAGLCLRRAAASSAWPHLATPLHALWFRRSGGAGPLRVAAPLARRSARPASVCPEMAVAGLLPLGLPQGPGFHSTCLRSSRPDAASAATVADPAARVAVPRGNHALQRVRSAIEEGAHLVKIAPWQTAAVAMRSFQRHWQRVDSSCLWPLGEIERSFPRILAAMESPAM